MKYWAFVANPEIYRIEDAFRECKTDNWTIKRANAVCDGDLALIWKAKGKSERRGIVGFAKIKSDPKICHNHNPGYFIDAMESATLEKRVDIRYFGGDILPLWYDEPYHTLPASLNCARARGGTVFSVSPEQWQDIYAVAGASQELDVLLQPRSSRMRTKQ